MKRRQLFEFQDQPWFPDLVREGQVEILSMATRESGLARAVTPAFSRLIETVGPEAVLDLCSGAGGPVVHLLEALAESGATVPPVLLSDLYPNVPAWERLRARWPERVDFVPRPVDATRIPADLDGHVVTIINGLHHFPLETAHTILGEVTRRGSALFVVEGFPRSFWRSSAMAPTLGMGLLKNPLRCERGGLAKALLSFALPLLTVTGLWDWFASTLRIHEPAELIRAARLIGPDYDWEHGAAWYPPWGKALYLSGIPRSKLTRHRDAV